jgi:hypothetical protein
MIRTLIRWQELVRIWVGHWLSRPFHHLFNMIPHWEVGCDDFDVSRLTCLHGPLDGRRAVHISDLHLDRYQTRHDRIVATIAGMRPDWIFVTGDLINVPDGLPHLFRFLGRLREIAPVFMTLGNHDHYSGVSVDQFQTFAERSRITLLLNQTVFIPAGDGDLAVAGVDDPSLHRADLRCLPPTRRGRFTLLLAHAPNIMNQLNESHAVDLILCGHSHGGQWKLPAVPTFWLPPGCAGHLDGLYWRHHRRLYVNRGMGWSGLPIRINCRPEVLVIEWVAESDKPAAAA